MGYWVIADTHFGHDAMIEYCNRPKGFENKIFSNLKRLLKFDDVLIHLGDVCIGNDVIWHTLFKENCVCKQWLVRGNHDHKTDHWYLNHGWDWVGEEMLLETFGKRILFTHIPINSGRFDINIHGHLHNTGHHPEIEITKPTKCIVLEHHYEPIKLITALIERR